MSEIQQATWINQLEERPYAITSFFGHFRFLSNFHVARFTYRTIEWPTSEHAYQAMKCQDDPERWNQFAKLRTPGASKRAGGLVSVDLDWWDSVKYSIMHDIVRAKFTQNEYLAKKLVDTGDRMLVEGNTWKDTYWGICSGKGQNMLGQILMDVRQDCRLMLSATNVGRLPI